MVTIKFETGNAAFIDNGLAREVCRTLGRIGDKIREAGLYVDMDSEYTIKDTNGNTIGRFIYEKDGE